jgi:hypothetical protein
MESFDRDVAWAVALGAIFVVYLITVAFVGDPRSMAARIALTELEKRQQEREKRALEKKWLS